MINLLILGLAVLTNLGIGTFVLSNNWRRAANRLFFALTVVASCWCIVNYLSTHQTTSSETLFYARWEIFWGLVYSFSAFLTVHTFPESHIHLRNRYLVPLLLFTGLVLALSQTDLIFSSLTGVGNHSQVTPGPGIVLYAAINIVLLVGSLYILTSRIRTSRGNTRHQYRFLLAAVIASNVTAFFTNFVLVNIFHISYLIVVSPYLTLIFVGITSYAIFAYHLFDIRLIIKRTVVYTLLLIFIISTYSLAVLSAAQIIQSDSVLSFANAIPNILAAIVIGFSIDPLKRWLEDRTDAFLYKKEYQQQAVLRDLSSHLNNVIGMDEALEIVMQTIVKTIKLNHAVSYVFQPAEKGDLAVKRVKQIGYPGTKNLLLQERDFTIEYFSQHPQIVTVEELLSTVREEERTIQESSRGSKKRTVKIEDLSAFIRQHARKQTVLRKLRSLDAEMAVPLHLGQQCIGLILLSGKLNDEPYNHNDLQLLELIGADAISSIQKAKLYEGDQMKSEFVSIASHELLTPISAMEGYLSMILDEGIGKVDDQARDYLSKVYLSSKRLSQLVKDLLSVSRIESGKMTINLQAVDMDKMVRDTIDQLRFVAKNKGLTIIYESPKPSLPFVKADPDRVMQVIVNLVSNAIKYTPSGSVTINIVKLHTPEIRVDVKDTGLGMSKEQRSHLFERFYRVSTPETVGIIGTGLGLYITKSILERMNGTISVQSAVHKGTTFSITLPIFKAETSSISS